ncbi:MAG: hypothetical protein P4L35_10795 [Ignavibacteriaceae bacterium]|nr:hypothetical protein [Ignavibacteriaceae bacterium]
MDIFERQECLLGDNKEMIYTSFLCRTAKSKDAGMKRGYIDWDCLYQRNAYWHNQEEISKST